MSLAAAILPLGSGMRRHGESISAELWCFLNESKKECFLLQTSKVLGLLIIVEKSASTVCDWMDTDLSTGT